MHGCAHFLRSNYVIQGVKNSIKKMFGFTPLCESQWQEVGFTLVLDNCTLPRSVVPILVSLWLSEPARAIFRLHVLLILSCLIPILSDTPPHHSERQIKGQWAVERTDVGVLKVQRVDRNCFSSLFFSKCPQPLFFSMCFVDMKLHDFLHKRFLGFLCNPKYLKTCSRCIYAWDFFVFFSARALFPYGTMFHSAAVCLWNESSDLSEAIFSWLCTWI